MIEWIGIQLDRFFNWMADMSTPGISSPADRIKKYAIKWERPASFCDLPDDQLRFIHDHQRCPYCRSDYGVYEGSAGGMTVNIFCGNPDCNSRFNVCDPTGGFFIPIGQFTGECPPGFIAQRRKEIALEASTTG